MSGPLTGTKIVEFAGIGPGPFCGMLFADMGAEVIRIDRKGAAGGRAGRFDIASRGKKSIALDLKSPDAIETVLKILEKADALIEGFRPGVMERLGLGPDVVLKRNPKMVYGRMTGWGQTGTIAHSAGHDLNYISLTGAVGAMGRKGQPPAPPLNLVGDFGGGALYLAMGVCAALVEAGKSGKGQVIDTAMTDGAASLMSMFYGMRAAGGWTNSTGENLLDGGAHFYDTYETRDGKYISLGSIEPQFYALLREKAGLTDPEFDKQMDKAHWPSLKTKIAAAIKTKTRDEWDALMLGTDVCYAPVLSIDEAPHHPHNKSRQTFVEIDGFMQPAPAPRFSRTKSEIQGPAPAIGEHTDSLLQSWGLDVAKLKASGAI
ncbi:MAG: CoA transferase [Alphaproteobacteria bacterium]|nr:CoA transferase [Alphaproteobacteria bacterium]